MVNPTSILAAKESEQIPRRPSSTRQVYPPLQHQYLVDLFVGVLINSFWTAVMHVQSYTWRRKFPNDRYYIKAMIGTMWLAQTFYFFSSSTMLYKALISEVKDSDDVPLWELKWMGPHKVAVTILYQVFFILRLWLYGRDLRVILPLVILAAATSGFGIFNAWYAWGLPISTDSPQFWWEKSAGYGLIMSTDVFVSIYLAFLMSRSKTGFKSTKSMMQLITVYGVATGAVTSMLALVGLISNQIGWFHGTYSLSMWAPALMICAILANLHLRSHLLDSIPSDEIIPASNISLHGIQRAQQRYSQQHAAANVYYHSVVHDPLGRSAHSGVAKFFLDDAENGMSSSSTMGGNEII